MTDKPIYEKLEAETTKAYEAFCFYRVMGLGRSVARVSKEHTKNLPTVKKWSTEHNWVQRAEAFDLDQEAIARQVLEEENRELYRKKLRKYNQENEEIGKALRSTAVIMLQKFRAFANDLDPKDIKTNNAANIVRSIETCIVQGDRLMADSLAIEKLLKQLEDNEENQS